MSWIEKLYKTYEACAGAPQFDSNPLLPVSHTEQQAHIEIVLDTNGNFQRAELVQKETTVVPATEKSAGRVGTRAPPHPLCDKVQYCAADYAAFGGRKEPFFKEYVEQLRAWVRAEPNPKAQAVLSYVERGQLIRDLIGQKILHCSEDGKLLTHWSRETPAPGIFKLLTAKEGERDQGDAFIRWRVQIAGDTAPSAVWQDQEVRDAWARFDAMQTAEGGVEGLCYVTGDTTLLASSHPKRIRHGADGAKLISSNDADGFTFRGRFSRPDQAYGAGILVTQKAHNALRWLVARQGYHDKSSGQVYVSWAISGKKIPDPLENTAQLLGIEPQEALNHNMVEIGDVGQHFAKRLSRAISGYKATINDLEEIVILGLDSATPGRMAITYYRELAAAEFLDRLYSWHNGCAWSQRYSSSLSFVGAPAPSDIAECAYGRRLDEKLSALQHLAFCERQWGLIHLEQQWSENRLTAEGRLLHENADSETTEIRDGVRTCRGLRIRSLHYGIAGRADVVEFRQGQPRPVEYKRGKPKATDMDEVQLCAQALCLEEMLSVSIPEGLLFYGEPRRRTTVVFDQALRQRVQSLIERLHTLTRAGVTPLPVFAPKCKNCSLLEVCEPKTTGGKSAKQYMKTALRQALGTPEGTGAP